MTVNDLRVLLEAVLIMKRYPSELDFHMAIKKIFERNGIAYLYEPIILLPISECLKARGRQRFIYSSGQLFSPIIPDFIVDNRAILEIKVLKSPFDLGVSERKQLSEYLYCVGRPQFTLLAIFDKWDGRLAKFENIEYMQSKLPLLQRKGRSQSLNPFVCTDFP